MPALPPDAITTPASGSGFERMRLNMPRALKLPPTCSCSSLSQSSAQSMPSSAAGQAQERRVAHVAGDAPARGFDVVAGDVDHCERREGSAAAILRRWTCPPHPPRAPSSWRAPGAHEHRQPRVEPRADPLRARRAGAPRREEPLTFDDEKRKANLFATVGEGKPAGVIVSGHTDTVPWDGQDWSFDPLGAELRDGRLYGRGSADMKGFIGLAVAQVPAFLAADLPFAIHLALSYDEEVGGFGAYRLVADLRERAASGRSPASSASRPAWCRRSRTRASTAGAAASRARRRTRR